MDIDIGMSLRYMNIEMEWIIEVDMDMNLEQRWL